MFHLLPGPHLLCRGWCNLRCSFARTEISPGLPEETAGKTTVPRELRILAVSGGMAQAQVVVTRPSPQDVVGRSWLRHNLRHTY